jgi:biopolymer transport protein TolR
MKLADCAQWHQGAKGATTMGMDVEGKKNGPLASINIIPLIDILLVLIIIFMVITPLAPKGLETVVPQPSRDVDPVKQDKVVVIVQVLGGDRLKINEDPATWDRSGPTAR